MPFLDDAFGAVMARWVFHLVAQWRVMVSEMCRVARPGGAVLVNLGAFRSAWEIVDRFLRAAGDVPFSVGLDPRHPEVLDAEFASHGAGVRILPAIRSHDDTSVGAFLDEMDEGMHSWTWRVPEEVRRAVVPEVRSWAKDRFGSLDRPLEPHVEIVWRAYDLPP